MAADTEQTIHSQQPRFYQKKLFWLLVALFLGAFLIRLDMTQIIHGHATDINNFKAWSMHAARNPFRLFYDSVTGKGNGGIWADYPPLYILVLWLTGKIQMLVDPTFAQWKGSGFTILTKLPAILTDLGCMAFLILILKRFVALPLALFAALIFALHPAVIYESAMWGQIDSVTLFLQLAAIWFLAKKDYTSAIIFTTLNILVKPQGLILMPLILFITAYRKQWLQLAVGLFASALVTFSVTAIFVPLNEILPWLLKQYGSQADLYSFSSIQAFNLWSLTGMWKSDARLAMGISHKTLGLIFFSLAYAGALAYYVFKARENDEDENRVILHASAWIMIAFFLFPTRMHERYLYSGLFLLLGSAMIQKRLMIPFIIYSITFTFNLLYELPGHSKEAMNKLGFPPLFANINKFLDGQQPQMWMGNFTWYKVIAVLNLLVFTWVLFILLAEPLQEVAKSFAQKLKAFFTVDPVDQDSVGGLKWIPAPQKMDRKDVYTLGLLLFSTAFLKLWRLGFPPEMVFDEVYHARAAGEFLIAVKPLEWVHPPLAKLLISLGAMLYELTGVGWRVMPVMAGTLLLASLYFLARFTLPHRWQAIVAVLLLSCDGVYFVQSRMAMTNIFATFFQVTALMFTWRFFQYHWHRPDRKTNYVYFMSAVFFIGLALSTRWTSLWSYAFMIGILGFGVLVPSTLNLPGLVHGKFQWTFNLRVLTLWVAIPGITVALPFALYLLSYMPYYINYGYDIAEVLKEQQRIWQYHSNLADPHPYYSAWYTWHWLARPTWYYFQSYKTGPSQGLLGGIFAVGNPAIWWTAVLMTYLVATLSWFKQRLSLVFMSLGFVCMFVPWALSPRTLNYAHYFFEAVPYICLCTAAVMGFLVEKLGKTGQVVSGAYFAVVVGLFALFYPLYSALPISWGYYGILRWFPSWV